MGQCCSDSIQAKAEAKEAKDPETVHSQDKKEKTVVPSASPKEAEVAATGRKSSLHPKKNIHNIKSAASLGHHGKMPKSTASTASASSNERIAKRKLARGMTPKVIIDLNKIMENLREKQTMRNDVALIGQGGRIKSAAAVKSSSSSLRVKSVQSDRHRKSSLEKSNLSLSKQSTRSCSSSKSTNSNNSRPKVSSHSDQKANEKQKSSINQKSSTGSIN